jgi:hypothetical protein
LVQRPWAWFRGPQPSQVDVGTSKKHETTPKAALTAHAWSHDVASPSNRRQGLGKKPAKMVRDGSPTHGGGGTVVVVLEANEVEVTVDEEVVVDAMVVEVGGIVVDVGGSVVVVEAGGSSKLQLGSQLPGSGGSHCSPKPVSTTPSPHRGSRQVARHASGAVSELASPSSHSSSGTRTPSPHTLTLHAATVPRRQQALQDLEAFMHARLFPLNVCFSDLRHRPSVPHSCLDVLN